MLVFTLFLTLFDYYKEKFLKLNYEKGVDTEKNTFLIIGFIVLFISILIFDSEKIKGKKDSNFFILSYFLLLLSFLIVFIIGWNSKIKKRDSPKNQQQVLNLRKTEKKAFSWL